MANPPNSHYLNVLDSLGVPPPDWAVSPSPTGAPQPEVPAAPGGTRFPLKDAAGKPIRAAYGADLKQYTRDYKKWKYQQTAPAQTAEKVAAKKRKREENDADPQKRAERLAKSREYFRSYRDKAAARAELEDVESYLADRDADASGPASQRRAKRVKSTGSRAQVWHGTARHTSGGLTKGMLMKNPAGRIVSRKASALAKKR